MLFPHYYYIISFSRVEFLSIYLFELLYNAKQSKNISNHNKSRRLTGSWFVHRMDGHAWVIYTMCSIRDNSIHPTVQLSADTTRWCWDNYAHTSWVCICLCWGDVIHLPVCNLKLIHCYTVHISYYRWRTTAIMSTSFKYCIYAPNWTTPGQTRLLWTISCVAKPWSPSPNCHV